MPRLDFHPAIKEALAVHECFRRLGYRSEEIYIFPPGHSNKDKKTIFVFIKWIGNPNSFSCEIDIPCDMPDFLDRWQEAADWWNHKATEDERKEIYQNSKILKVSMDLIIALRMNDFPWGAELKERRYKIS